jgi:hypothetical protein
LRREDDRGGLGQHDAEVSGDRVGQGDDPVGSACQGDRVGQDTLARYVKDGVHRAQAASAELGSAASIHETVSGLRVQIDATAYSA